jgi:hypothetical protein
MLSQLPFQQGSPLPVIEEQGSTEILTSTNTAESRTGSTLHCTHSREIFMLHQPLYPPQEPDVIPNDETPSMISYEDPEVPNESDQDKATRLRRNKAKHVWK